MATSPLQWLPYPPSDLIGFMEGQRRSPDYELWLCLGEKWPDTERPWNRKLIMVQVGIPHLLQLSLVGNCEHLPSPCSQ